MEENKRNTKYLYLKSSLQETLKIFWKRKQEKNKIFVFENLIVRDT
jgi:hypothetical protein